MLSTCAAFYIVNFPYTCRLACSASDFMLSFIRQPLQAMFREPMLMLGGPIVADPVYPGSRRGCSLAD